MANLKEIRGRIKSVKNTQQVTKAMKLVAAAKLRRSQDRILQLRPYAEKLRSIIDNVTSSLESEEIPSEFIDQREVNNILILLVTSNRGLAGPFNTNIIKHTNQFIQEHYPTAHKEGQLHFICMGRKGYEYFSKRGFNTIGGNRDVFSPLTFENVNKVTSEVFEGYLNGTYDKVHLVYNEFKNVMSQIRRADEFLPLSMSALNLEGEGSSSRTKVEYIFEPEKEEILKELIPRALRIQIFRAVLESNAAEQGSRMVAMDAATENAEELLRTLKINYNKARQAAITKEILEISAGADALG